MGVSGGIPAAEARAEAHRQREGKKILARALLSLAEDAGMPDSFWASDTRVRLAIDALWPGQTVARYSDKHWEALS